MTMALMLAEIAAGLPMAASFAFAGGFSSFREGRRRAALNEALHELRRPLQALALAAPAEPEGDDAVDSSLRLASAALRRLDREINGGRLDGGVAAVRIRPLVEAAARRWQTRATLAGGSLRLRWRAGDPLVEGDELELAQALDNLISNGLQHGGREVAIEVSEEGAERLRISVLDPAQWLAPPGRPAASVTGRISGRRRHGHGLRVVRRTAAAHGGGFELRRDASGTRAVISLPLLREGERG